jgi:predicted permease
MDRTLTRWLARLTDPELAEAIVGDLVEERERRARTSHSRAAVWFWWQVLTIAFGASRQRAADRVRDTWRWMMRPGSLGIVVGDARYAVRSLVRAPWYSVAVIGVIALAVTLATTVFAVVDGVLFKPLPYPGADRLVSVEAGSREAVGRTKVSPVDVAGWSQAMPDVMFTAFRLSNNARFEDVNDPALGVAEVQANFFDTIGVRPIVGGFSQDWFAQPSVINPTIISDELWRTRFDRDPEIVGRRIRRGTASMEIVGVMPPGFVFPGRINAQVLMPLVLSPQERARAGMRSFEVIARLPPLASRDDVTRRLEAAMQDVARSLPPVPPPPPGMRIANAEPFDRAVLHPLDVGLRSKTRPMFLVVFLAAGALVLLACANVSGLLAARGLDRRRELGMRRALGAGASDIVRLVTAEAAWLVGAGTAVGLALVSPFLAVVLRLLPRDVPLLKTPAIDWRVGWFVAATMCVAVACVSMWPIRRGLRAGANTHPVDDTTRETARTRSFGRDVIVAAQVAIALALTIGGTLLVGSLVRLWHDDIGIDTDDVFAVELRVPAAMADADPAALDAITDRLLQRVRALPGVTEAGATDAPLFRNTTWGDLGIKAPAGVTPVLTTIHGVTSGFFAVVRPRLVSGRLPSDADVDAGRDVIVVSASMAAAYWPGSNPIGQTLRVSAKSGVRPFTVVAVVGDARFAAWDDTAERPVYVPIRALPRGISPNILIRTRAAVGPLFAEIQRFMTAEGPDVRAIRAQRLNEMLADTVRPRRFQSFLFGSFGVAALAIVGVGILGLMAMSAARRTKEIGIRVALGATKTGVMRLFVTEQVAPVVAGIIAGGVLAAWAVRFVKASLYELTTYDPRVWIVAVLLILITAVLGTIIPAARASRVDPVKALRID